MATHRDLSIVNISLQDSGVSADGFGIPIFISSHRYFKERVRSYNSLSSVAEDIPLSTLTYSALEQAFSASPSPSTIKVGRREADLTLTVASGSTKANLILGASDGTNTFSVTINISSLDSSGAVATAIAAAIEADSNIGSIVDTLVAGSTVIITEASPSDSYFIKSMSSELTDSYTSTENAAEVLQAIEDVDSDFYFVASDDHTETYVLQMSDAIEARKKQYFVSLSASNALTAYVTGAATDIFGKIKDNGEKRTVMLFSQDADTKFPELYFAAYNSVYPAGSVSWTNLKVSLPLGTSSGVKLSNTQKGFLASRDVSFVSNIGGNNVLRGGRTASGSRIDAIHGRDNLESDLEVAYNSLLINQQGGKIPYTNAGITQLANICKNTLSRYVVRGFINAGFEKFVIFPSVDKVSLADKEAGIYQSGTFKAELTGSIDAVGPINGTLVISLG
jgi:hypothetical protein